MDREDIRIWSIGDRAVAGERVTISQQARLIVLSWGIDHTDGPTERWGIEAKMTRSDSYLAVCTDRTVFVLGGNVVNNQEYSIACTNPC